MAKVEAAREQGAIVHIGGNSVDACVHMALERAESGGLAFVHPFDDPAIVAGQGSLGLELLEDVPDLAKVVIPVGGGGLAAGVALAIKDAKPSVQIVGVQAAACAPFPESMAAGEPIEASSALTIADGIAVKRPGGITLPILTELADEFVMVGEDETAEAMALLLERCKLVVEGAGAVGVAALLGGQVKPAATGTTVAVLSGGNIDAGLLSAIARRHETESGRRLVMLTRVADRPGGLATLLATVAGTGANIVDVSHVREGLDLHVRETAVELVLETRGHEHAQRVLGTLHERGLRGAGPPVAIFNEPLWGRGDVARRAVGADRVPMRASVIALLLVLFTAPAARRTRRRRSPSAPSTAARTPTSSPRRENLDLIRDAVACLHNRTRAQKRLRVLAPNDALAEAAAGHAGDMVARGYFDHETPEGGYFDQRILATGYTRGANGYKVGENLIWASGDLATPAELMRSWLASAGHRANILKAAYRELGLGVAFGTPDGERRRDDRRRVRRPRLRLAARSGQGAGKAARRACADEAPAHPPRHRPGRPRAAGRGERRLDRVHRPGQRVVRRAGRLPQGPAHHRRQLALADAGRRRHDRRRPGHRPDPGHGPRRPAAADDHHASRRSSGDGGTFAPAPVQLSFSPDGTKIAYAYVAYSCPVASTCGSIQRSVFYTHADVTEATPISVYGNQHSVSNPEWVTNSRTLVFGGYGRQVAIDDLDAGDYNAKPWMVPNGDMGDGEVSRDGKRLAVTMDYGANTKLAFFAVSGNVATEFPPAYPELSCSTTERRREVRRPLVVARRLGHRLRELRRDHDLALHEVRGRRLRGAERLRAERDRHLARLGPDGAARRGLQAAGGHARADAGPGPGRAGTGGQAGREVRDRQGDGEGAAQGARRQGRGPGQGARAGHGHGRAAARSPSGSATAKKAGTVTVKLSKVKKSLQGQDPHPQVDVQRRRR